MACRGSRRSASRSAVLIPLPLMMLTAENRSASLGVLAQVAPSTDEFIYAWQPAGFALHSMRSHEVSRFYLQVAPDEDVAEWSDDRREGAEPGDRRRRAAGAGDHRAAQGRRLAGRHLLRACD